VVSVGVYVMIREALASFDETSSSCYDLSRPFETSFVKILV